MFISCLQDVILKRTLTVVPAGHDIIILNISTINTSQIIILTMLI